MAKKLKISLIKRNNQKRTKLMKQGKLKTRRHKPAKKQVQKTVPLHTEAIEEEESDHGEDLMNMVEKDDLDFLREAISNKSYNLLQQIRLNETVNSRKDDNNQKRKNEATLEEVYENDVSKIMKDKGIKKVRMLLPTKTQNGVIEKRLIEETNNEDNENESDAENDTQDTKMEEEKAVYTEDKDENKRPVSMIEFLACRKEVLRSKRLKIGLLSSTLLETPENKSENFKALLELMEETNPEVYVTVRKLATVSLLEVFKDLLPAYHILQIQQEGVRFKKETLALQNYEAILLRSYKRYLQKLEKMAGVLRKKKGDRRQLKEQYIELGRLALNCMFAHCINMEFYQDLVTVIDKLMEEGNLSMRNQLHCIQCVFTILSGQGSALNLDPYRFYVHLYKNLLNIHCGKTHPETEILIKTLVQVLIHRRKRITQNRLTAFIKRMAIVTMQSQHNAAISILGIIKQSMQLGKAANVLLDTDRSAGDGFYQPELEEPECCNAHCSALWELAALQRHYHRIVQKIAKNIASGVPSTGEGSLSPDIAKLTPEELYAEFDPSGVVFNPSVPVPKKTNVKGTVTTHRFISSKFNDYVNTINNIELFVNEYVDFYKAYNSQRYM
ncbi:nucleolar complex protein 3 isoform X3 [Colletes latitarsis]|uniref:nucleolar complex protein 3 isoform X3 n=1 Tax=Colletes latitarsis TaxID=2605962 RepID=UPI004035640A